MNVFYESMSRGKGLGVIGTALVRKSAEKSVFGITIDSDGNYNGASWDIFKMVGDLALSAVSNINVARNIARNPKSAPKGFDYARLDEYANIVQYRDGWYAVGRMFINAFQDSSGKRLIQAAVSTGQGDDECVVQEMRCGIYPANASEIAWINMISSTRIQAITYAVGYEATLNYNSANPSDPIWEYAPSSSAWNASDSVQKDYVEEQWTSGFSIGSSYKLTKFEPSISVAYSKSNTFTKRTDRWGGVGNYTKYQVRAASGSTPAAYGIGAISGISLIPTWRLEENGFNGFIIDEGQKDIEANEKKLAEEIMTSGMKCGGISATTGITKPRISFHGYRPGLTAMFINQDNLWITKIVTGGLKWHRSNAYYNFSNSWPCTTVAYPGMGIPKAMGWLKENRTSMMGQEYGVSKEYWVGANITVQDKYFTMN